MIELNNIALRPVGLILARSAPAAASADPELAEWLSRIQLPAPKPCSHTPTLTLISIDGSGSLTAHGGNDPLGRRFDEARHVLSRVARCRCGNERVAIVHFDPGPSDRGPIELTRRTTATIDEALIVPNGGTGSNLSPSLDRIEKIVNAEGTGAAINVVILSDFELFDADVDATLKRLGRIGNAHAVVLNNRVPPAIDNHSTITVSHVRHDSEPGVVAAAMQTGLTAARTAGPTTSAAKPTRRPSRFRLPRLRKDKR